MSYAPSVTSSLTRRDVIRQAWPIILAGAAVPMLGLVDTAVMGHVGSTAELAALGLSTLLFNFLLWSFGFLRMATTGFVARATGAGQGGELVLVTLRGLFTALLVGAVLLVVQGPVQRVFFPLMEAGPAVAQAGAAYVHARIWGAPAALCLFVLCGVLIGLGQGGRLLRVQLVLNGLNALLDVVLAGWLGLGIAGVGWGTVVAEWLACGLAMVCVYRAVRERFPAAVLWPGCRRLCDGAGMRRLWSANIDLLVRTVCLLAGFAWFARLGGQLGEGILAANHLLLQCVAFCAFFLDGFAHVAEVQVGEAFGARQGSALRRAIRLTSEVAVMTALLLGGLLWATGAELAALLTSLPEVKGQVSAVLPLAALYVVLSVAAFQLDGIFVGVTDTRAMRNAVALALAGFVCLSWPAMQLGGNAGLWVAMVGYGVLRAVALLPALKRLWCHPDLRMVADRN